MGQPWWVRVSQKMEGVYYLFPGAGVRFPYAGVVKQFIDYVVKSHRGHILCFKVVSLTVAVGIPVALSWP